MIPIDSKGAHAAPLFEGKDGLCTFMREIKRNAGKETKDVLEQKTNDALKQREWEFGFVSDLMEIASAFPDDELKQENGKFLFASKIIQFVAKYPGLFVSSMQERRDK